MIGDYYATCMDEAAIEAAGLKGLDPCSSRLTGSKTIKAW